MGVIEPPKCSECKKPLDWTNKCTTDDCPKKGQKQ